MGLPLQRQANALYAGRGKADHYSKLHVRRLALYSRGGMAAWVLTATLAPGESSTMVRVGCRRCTARVAT